MQGFSSLLGISNFQNWDQVPSDCQVTIATGSSTVAPSSLAQPLGAMKAVLALLAALAFTRRCAAQSILAYKEKVSESRIIVQLG